MIGKNIGELCRGIRFEMGKMSRDKGARGERELFDLLSEHLGFVVRRNVDQARAGGADGVEIPGWAIEVKRRESLSLPSWWRQTVEQAIASGRKPILFYRRNGERWQAVIEDDHSGIGMLVDPKDSALPLGRRRDFDSALSLISEGLR